MLNNICQWTLKWWKELIVFGVPLLALILFLIFWLPILEWFCKFKEWC